MSEKTKKYYDTLHSLEGLRNMMDRVEKDLESVIDKDLLEDYKNSKSAFMGWIKTIEDTIQEFPSMLGL